jgi:hypothetical protein
MSCRDHQRHGRIRRNGDYCDCLSFGVANTSCMRMRSRCKLNIAIVPSGWPPGSRSCCTSKSLRHWARDKVLLTPIPEGQGAYDFGLRLSNSATNCLSSPFFPPKVGGLIGMALLQQGYHTRDYQTANIVTTSYCGQMSPKSFVSGKNVEKN